MNAKQAKKIRALARFKALELATPVYTMGVPDTIILQPRVIQLWHEGKYHPVTKTVLHWHPTKSYRGIVKCLKRSHLLLVRGQSLKSFLRECRQITWSRLTQPPSGLARDPQLRKSMRYGTSWDQRARSSLSLPTPTAQITGPSSLIM